MTEQAPLTNLTLHVKIEDRSQLISDYAFDGDNLNPALSDYLIEKAECVSSLPRQQNFTIKLHTTKEDLHLPDVTRCLHRHFHDAYDAEKRKLRSNLHLALFCFALGMLALVAQYFMALYWENFFVNEFFNIVAWVFTWAAVEVTIIDRHSIRRRCKILRRLAFAEVVIANNTELDATPVYI